MRVRRQPALVAARDPEAPSTVEMGPGFAAARPVVGRASLSKTLLASASVWAASYLLWLLFSASTAMPELLVGGAAASVATWALAAVEARKMGQIAPSARWFARAVWLPWYVLVDTGRILAVLVRHLAGSKPAPSLLFAAPYDANGDDDESATKRALAIAYTTMTPNSIVIDVDTSRGLVFFHQLRDSATSKMTRSLGVGA